MPKKKAAKTAAEQSAEFQRAAQEMIDAGELDPIEGAAALDKIVKRSRKKKGETGGG